MQVQHLTNNVNTLPYYVNPMMTEYLAVPQPNHQHQQLQVTPPINYIPVPVTVPSYSPNLEPNTFCPQNTAMIPFSLTPSAVSTNTSRSSSPQPMPQLQVPTHLHPNVILGGNSPGFQTVPVPVSASPSPILGAVPEPFCFQNTPSPSPSPAPSPSLTPSPTQTAPLMQNVQPDLSQCLTLYELQIIRHQATTKSIADEYSSEIAEAMRKVLNINVWYLFVVVTEQAKAMTIQWAVHPHYCDFGALTQLTQMPFFKEALICELAHVGNGSFNKHLHGSKQLTIINEGRKAFEKLSHALESHNDAKSNLLNTSFSDRFAKKNVDDLFRVCEADKGKALRGDSVIGGHFRGGDVLKMLLFIDIVEATIGAINRATMIPSMKGKAQYKGWSIYIETPSLDEVEAIKAACATNCFEKAEIFVAVDNFKHRD